MNKARKLRQRRRERDLRWIARDNVGAVTPGSHRYKKLFGVPKKKGKYPHAFWCQGDPEPLIVQLHAKVLTCDVFAFPDALAASMPMLPDQNTT